MSTERQLHDQGEWLIEFLLAKLTDGSLSKNKLPAIRISDEEKSHFENVNLKIIDFQMAVPIARITTVKNKIINHIDSQHRIDLLVLLKLDKKITVWFPIEVKLGGNFKKRKVDPSQTDFSKIGSVSNILSHHAKREDKTFKNVNFLLPPRLTMGKKDSISKSWGLLLRDGCSEKERLNIKSKYQVYKSQNIKYIFCLCCIYKEIEKKINKKELEIQITKLILGDNKTTLAKDLLNLCSPTTKI
jgi:hypothetical protein